MVCVYNWTERSWTTNGLLHKVYFQVSHFLTLQKNFKWTTIKHLFSSSKIIHQFFSFFFNVCHTFKFIRNKMTESNQSTKKVMYGIHFIKKKSRRVLFHCGKIRAGYVSLAASVRAAIWQMSIKRKLSSNVIRVHIELSWLNPTRTYPWFISPVTFTKSVVMIKSGPAACDVCTAKKVIEYNAPV